MAFPALLGPCLGRSVVLVSMLAGGLAGGGCSSPTDEEAPMEAPERITVSSPAFGEGEAIPGRYSCDGPGQSPPLEWKGVPDDAAALALLVDDPDAPRGTFVHWLVVDIPATARAVEEGAAPPGVEVRSSAGDPRYFPPCPPSGTHRYQFTVYALSTRTGLSEGAALDEGLRAVRENAVAWGRLTATYTRRG